MSDEKEPAAGQATQPQEQRIVEHYPPPLPEDELPPPTFRQALVGYGSIMIGLVLLGLLVGLLMKVLR